MRYKKFQRAGIDVSAVAVGTWAIGGSQYGEVNDQDSIAAIRAMIDCGVNIVDTAPIYGNGHSEEVVGRALQGIRDKVLLCTKFGTYNSSYTGDVVYDCRYDSVFAFCENSMQRLKTDYFDFYYIHWPEPDGRTPISETMAALNELKKQGKIRFIGVSNFTKEQVIEAERYGQIDVIQPPFSMVNQSQRELMEWAYLRGIDTMTYGSLGSGILTGAIRSIPNFSENDLRLTFYDFYREPKFSKIMELLKTLDKIAEKHNRPVAQVAINWSTQQPFVGTALVGARNTNEAAENCATFDWQLADEELTEIDAALNKLQIG